MRTLLPVLVLCAALLGACGGDAADPPEPGTIAGAGLKIALPEGWLYAAGEHEAVMASAAADLEGDTTDGPRFRVSRIPEAAIDRRLMLMTAEDAREVAAAVTVLEEPVMHAVGAMSGVSIALQEESAEATMVRRHVYVSGERGVVYYFVFEAPVEAWDASQEAFRALGASVVYP